MCEYTFVLHQFRLNVTEIKWAIKGQIKPFVNEYVKIIDCI